MQSMLTTLAQAQALGPPPARRLSVPVFDHGTLEVRLYEPRGEDQQTPHTRDELYVVAAGSAEFCDADGARDAGIGTCIFVAANCAHHFRNMSADFAVWVMFYGPEGGEAGAP